jgi:hypothetical protein
MPTEPIIEPYERVAWQVFNIYPHSDPKKPSRITLPHDLAFGSVTITEDADAVSGHTHVSSSHHKLAPPGWLLAMHYEPGGLSFKDLKKRKKDPHHVLVKNKSNVPRKLAMGTYHIDDEGSRFQPFFVLQEVRNNKQFSARHQLVLQAYQSHDVEVKVGQVLPKAMLDTFTPLLGNKGKEVAGPAPVG